MGSLKSSEDYQVAVTLDGRWILSKKQRTKMIVRDSATDEPIKKLNLRASWREEKINNVECAAKSIDGHWLILIFLNNTFTEWNLSETFGDKTKTSFLLRAVSSNSKWALRETKSGRIQVQDLKTGKVKNLEPLSEKIYHYSKGDIYKFTISNDGSFALIQGRFISGVGFWDLKDDKIIPIFDSLYKRELRSDNTTALSVSSNGKLCCFGLKTGIIYIYEIEDPYRIYSQQIHPTAVTCVAFSADNQQIVSGSKSGTINVWNWESQAITNFKLEIEVSLCIFHAKKNIIIAGDNTEQIHTFEQILPDSSLSKNNSSIAEFSEDVSLENTNIIYKNFYLKSLPETSIANLTIFGPGHLTIELYYHNRLLTRKNEFVQAYKEYNWYNFRLGEFTDGHWEEPLIFIVTVRPPDGNFLYKVYFTVSCLITDLNVWKKYARFKGDCRGDWRNYGFDTLNKNYDALKRWFTLQEELLGINYSETQKTLNKLIEVCKSEHRDVEVGILENKTQEIQNICKEEIIAYEDDSLEGQNSRPCYPYISIKLNSEDIVNPVDSEEILDPKTQEIIPFTIAVKQEWKELLDLLSILKEPSIDRLEYLTRAWGKLRSIFNIIMPWLKGNFKSLLETLRQASIPNQLTQVLGFCRTFPSLSTIKILIGFLIITFLGSISGKFAADGIYRWMNEIYPSVSDFLISWIAATGGFCVGSVVASLVGTVAFIPIFLKNFSERSLPKFLTSTFIENQKVSKIVFTFLYTLIFIAEAFIIDIDEDLLYLTEEDSESFIAYSVFFEIVLPIFLILIFLIFSIFLLFCILFCLFGIVAGGSFGASIETGLGVELGKWLTANDYWFLVLLSAISTGIGTFIGDFIERIFRQKRISSINIIYIAFINIIGIASASILAALFGAKKYLGTIFWSLAWWLVINKLDNNSSRSANPYIQIFLGVIMGMGFSNLIGNYFSDDLPTSIAFRSASGALIAVILAVPSKTGALGALGGAVASFFLSVNPPIQTAVYFLKNALATIGILFWGVVGVIVGIVVSIVVTLCFSIVGVFALTGIYLHFQKIAEDFQRRGYNSVFGFVILALVALLGSGLGLAISSFL